MRISPQKGNILMAQEDRACHNDLCNGLGLDTKPHLFQLFLYKKQAMFLGANPPQQNPQLCHHNLLQEEHLDHHVTPLNKAHQ